MLAALSAAGVQDYATINISISVLVVLVLLL